MKEQKLVVGMTNYSIDDSLDEVVISIELKGANVGHNPELPAKFINNVKQWIKNNNYTFK